MFLILQLINYIINIIEIIVIIRIVVSWLLPMIGYNNGFVRFIFQITEPLLKPFRVIFPMGRSGGIDFSPVILFIVLWIIQSILARLMLGM